MRSVISIGDTARRADRFRAPLASPHGSIPLRDNPSNVRTVSFGASRLRFRAVAGGRKLRPAVAERPTFKTKTCRHHHRCPMRDCERHLACCHARSTPRQLAGETAGANRLRPPGVQSSLGAVLALCGRCDCQRPRSPGICVRTARGVASIRAEDLVREALRLEGICGLAVGEVLITAAKKQQQHGRSQTVQLRRNQRAGYDTLVDDSSDAR